MTTFTIETDIQRLHAALQQAPGVLERHISQAIRNSVKRIAVTARMNAPKAFSTLEGSIQDIMISNLEGVAGPSTNYAEYVEKGTGPRGRAPLSALQGWIKVKGITPREPLAGDPDQAIRSLAFIIQRSILAKGTPKQPYLIPAAEQHEAATHTRIDQAIDAALREIGGS